MTIYGIERGFKLTVGAYKEIASMLPDGNIEELGAILSSGDPFNTMTAIFNLAVIMNKRYETQQKFLNSDYKPNRPLTVEELETLSMDEVIGELKDEVIRAIIESQHTEIELKKTEAEKESENSPIR